MPIPRIAALRQRYALHPSVIMSHERMDLIFRTIEQQHDIIVAYEQEKSGDKAKVMEAYEALDKDVISFIEDPS